MKIKKITEADEDLDIKAALLPVFQKYPELVFVYLFGSRADGSANPQSDIDLAVYVKEPRQFSFMRKLDLHGDCCRALRSDKVDLIVLNQSKNLLLKEQVLRRGVILLNRDPVTHDAYYVKLLHAAIDFREHRRKYIGI